MPEGTNDADVDKVYAAFKDYYRQHCADKTKPYNGIVSALRKLKAEGYKLAVVSNKADFGVQILCKKYSDGLFPNLQSEQKKASEKSHILMLFWRFLKECVWKNQRQFS